MGRIGKLFISQKTRCSLKLVVGMCTHQQFSLIKGKLVKETDRVRMEIKGRRGHLTMRKGC